MYIYIYIVYVNIYIYIRHCHAIQVLTQIKPGLGYTWFLHALVARFEGSDDMDD